MRLIDTDKISSSDMNHPTWIVLCKQPCVDAAPIKHGHWEKRVISYGFYHVCSECGNAISKGLFGGDNFFNYCPHCGAKMSVEESK